MRLIGHRGAAGMALENTIASIKAAMACGVHAIEIDVRLTRDHELVVFHDSDLRRLADDSRLIAECGLGDIKKIRLKGNQPIPTLKEVLKLVKSYPLIIELKSKGAGAVLDRLLRDFAKATVTVASFNHNEAAAFKRLRPEVPVYLAERTRPLDIVRLAEQAGADGLDLNFWLLNPLTYWLARRAGLDIMLYTVDRPWLARYIHWLYPHAALCTNYPDKLRSI